MLHHCAATILSLSACIYPISYILYSIVHQQQFCNLYTDTLNKYVICVSSKPNKTNERTPCSLLYGSHIYQHHIQYPLMQYAPFLVHSSQFPPSKSDKMERMKESNGCSNFCSGEMMMVLVHIVLWHSVWCWYSIRLQTSISSSSSLFLSIKYSFLLFDIHTKYCEQYRTDCELVNFRNVFFPSFFFPRYILTFVRFKRLWEMLNTRTLHIQ